MAQVVKATLQQSSSVEQAMELMRHNRTVERTAVGSRKDQSELVRAGSVAQFDSLSYLVLTQFVNDRGRKRQRPPASLGLQIDQSKLAIDPL